ncbi:MAG TPA: CPBP family intramembrane glutamic endopeptidase [Candidatus Binatia bacterium]|nr:CPBP family intramembrane glutamic endopeptidase [Candidatus Binatia bacterium]
MKSYQRLLLFVLLVLGLTALISPWAAIAWDLMSGAESMAREDRIPFSRIFNRLFMISGVLLFFAYRPLLKIESPSQLGLTPRTRARRDVAIGLCLALGSMLVLGFIMSLAEVYKPFFRLSLGESLVQCVQALLTGFTVGFLEEIFFRGIIFRGLLEDWKPLPAFLVANLFYAALHFVKPGEEYFLSGIDPWAGFRHLFSTFAPFLEPAGIAPGMIGLLLIGIALSYAFLRTATLYLSIGLHAGWIISIKTVRVFGDYQRENLGWLFGSTDPKIVSGVVTWAGILLVGIAVYWITRRRAGLSVPQDTARVPVTREATDPLA